MGSRALRGRSILGNAESPDVQKQINQIRSAIPEVTHVGFSARIQTVHKATRRLSRKTKGIAKMKISSGTVTFSDQLATSVAAMAPRSTPQSIK